MTVTPVHLLALLLFGALISAALSLTRPHQVRVAALITVALFSFVWLLVRAMLPLSAAIGPSGSAWTPWFWQIDALNWSISLAILLVTLASLALTQPAAQSARPLFIHLLACATLIACWAGDFAAAVAAWSLLNLLWLFIANLPSRSPASVSLPLSLSRQAGLAFSGIFFLWLAGASDAVGSASGPEAWSTVTRSLVLVAAAFQLLVFPLFLWRAAQRAAAPLAALLHLAPTAAGAQLLLRLESAVDIGLAFALPFTLTGLLAIFMGARRAWISADRRAALPGAFIQAQSGFVLLAAVWAGAGAILGEVTVLLLAGSILLLATAYPMNPASRLPLQPAVLIAVAALAALPLTAGFTGRSGAYAAWLQQGHWLLVLVSIILHLPLLAAAFNALRAATSPQTAKPPSADLVPLIALMLPALGLFSLSALGEGTLIASIAALLPAAAAALLVWRLEETAELRQALREAITVPLPQRAAWLDVRRPLASFATAARDALTLLEGEGGLLWLLVFVVIIYLVR